MLLAMNYENELIVILALIFAPNGLALKCFFYNEIIENPWVHILNNPDSFSITCEGPLEHFGNQRESPFTNEEKAQYSNMKTVCVKAIRDLENSPDPKFYFGDCGYWKKGVHDPCTNLRSNTKAVRGLRLLHCEMCATDNCNVGDPDPEMSGK